MKFLMSTRKKLNVKEENDKEMIERRSVDWTGLAERWADLMILQAVEVRARVR
jgi:hypothetical protein